MNREIALIAGAGPGLGSALAQRFAQAGMSVAMAARRSEKLDPLVDELTGLGVQARRYDCDVVSEVSVETLFSQAQNDLGVPHLVVYNAGAFVRKGILETSAEEFEHCWKVGCLGGFLVGRAAARLMLTHPEGGAPPGTIIFTGAPPTRRSRSDPGREAGLRRASRRRAPLALTCPRATASLRGGAMFHNLAVGKFGLRALAQSMAREFQPKGIHVAHVVIDGQIESDRPGYRQKERGPDAALDPAAIAEAYYQLHRQQRSAWTLELDLRPWVEKF